ncbi:MAG: hypothetical protein ACK6DZ_18060 [Acidobacteriota bacterium]|jgi:hypothetical protein
MDVHIGSIQTEITVTEGTGPLDAQTIQRIVKIVMEQLAQKEQMEQQRMADVTIHDRAYRQKGL